MPRIRAKARSKEELLADLATLDTGELRTLNRYHLHPQDQRCCNKCRTIFQGIAEHFHIKKHFDNSTVFNVKCKHCFNEINRTRTIRYRQSPHDFIRARFASYVCRARKERIPCDITKEYLVEQWDRQRGRCFYTDEEIDFSFVTDSKVAPHLRTPSLDKLTPRLGYTIGNVVWCSYGINRMKNDLDYATFLKACRVVLETRENQ